MNNIKRYTIILFVMFIFTGCTISEKSKITGIYYTGEDGKANLIIYDHEVASLQNQTDDEKIYQDLQNGDTVEITYDMILESYPAKIPFYDLKLVKKGDESELPSDIVNDYIDKQNEMRTNIMNDDDE